MAKADLGTKRLCPHCGTKYYDLNRDPIICPHCGTKFEVQAPTRGRASARPAPVAEEEAPVAEEVELVSLEEADAEAGGPAAEEGEEDEVEVADDEPDDTFLEPEEEEGDDVTAIIGDVDEEER